MEDRSWMEIMGEEGCDDSSSNCPWKLGVEQDVNADLIKLWSGTLFSWLPNHQPWNESSSIHL